MLSLIKHNKSLMEAEASRGHLLDVTEPVVRGGQGRTAVDLQTDAGNVVVMVAVVVLPLDLVRRLARVWGGGR